MIIPGEKVLLRPIQPEDFPILVEWGNDPELITYVEGNYPRSLAECPDWYLDGKANRHCQRFAIVNATGDETLIGDIELDHIAWRSGDAELRIRIGDKDHWDKGYGTEAVQLLCQHAFHSMNLSRVYLRVFSFNKRAIRCYEKNGFRKEGRLQRRDADGKTVVVFLMRVLKDEFIARESQSLHNRFQAG